MSKALTSRIDLDGLVEKLKARALNARTWAADTAPEHPTARARHRREAEELEQAAAAIAAQQVKIEQLENEAEELAEIGERDGYERAVQDIDRLTGGDGEYRFCTDGDPDRHMPDAAAIKARIVSRLRSSDAPTMVPQNGLRMLADLAVRAALGAQLPSNFHWGADAMEQFNFGKERAAEAVRGAISNDDGRTEGGI